MKNNEACMPAAMILGKPTFWGAYLTHRDQIARDRGWNEDTLRGYEAAILNRIVPHIPNHNRRPLSALAEADFKAALNAIRREGYLGENGTVCRYDEETLDRFWYLMEVVTETAERNYLCRNVLHRDPEAAARERAGHLSGQVVPRYMPPGVEQRAGDLLLTDPMQDGARMGLAGMLSWGARNAEAAGLNFGDVRLWRDIPGFWVAWVYKSTQIDSNALQSSGKTRNADRVVLLPDRYVRLILERKRRLQELLGPEVDVDELPVACRGEDYTTRCSADDLTVAARQLFAQLKIPPEHIEQAHEDVQRVWSVEGDPLNRLSLTLTEKEPTAYYLRRVYGTALVCAGLSERDVAFQIGHDLGTVPELRNELLDTDHLLKIKARLDRRPVVNDSYDRQISVQLSRNCAAAIPDGSRVAFRIPEGADRVELHLSAREPQEEIRVSFRMTGEGQAQVSATSYPMEAEEYPADLDVTDDYHKLYQNDKE